ncbi:MAG: hypothetical protein M3Q10_09530 [Chloroflexota bacterium]|nr:hypothetical protein [Chloroflexota bacterium]
MLALLLVAILSACAAGTADEARVGQARDAATDPDLPRQQSTRTAERFFPKTPTPTPAPPPPPTLGELVVTLGLDAGDAPQGSYLSVPADAGNVFAAALLNGVREGEVVSARWVDAAGNSVDTSRVEIDQDADQRWVALPFGAAGGVGPGEYAVYLYVGERRLSSLLFQVGPAGSGGQMLPARPENPNADRGGPGEVPNQRGGQPNQRDGGATGADPNAQGPDYGAPPAQNQQNPGQDPNAQQPPQVVTDPAMVPEQGTGEFVPTPAP